MASIISISATAWSASFTALALATHSFNKVLQLQFERRLRRCFRFEFDLYELTLLVFKHRQRIQSNRSLCPVEH